VLAAAVAAPAVGPGVPDLSGVAEAAGRALGARGCVVVAGGRDYGWGETGGDAAEYAVEYGGARVGTLRVAPPRRQAPRLASALGAVLENARLAGELDSARRAGLRDAAQTADARWRAAAEMDGERRAVERDLHDGAQHHLVALRLAMGLLEFELESGADPRARLDQLADRLDVAETMLVATAAGILPVALVTDGLLAALAAELGPDSNVRFDTSGVIAGRRYPAAVESAVYFACMEAVNNARKHAPGASTVVALSDAYRGLAFTITDTGPGFEAAASWSGLHHMRARVAAVGGRLQVRSTPEAGTTVDGFVPI